MAHLTPTGVDLMTRGWVMVAAGGAVFAIFMIVSGVRVSTGDKTDPLATAAWLLLISYLLHQFEEHGVDLMGRPYAFMEYGNAMLAERFPDRELALTELSIYRINTLGIWVPFLLAIWAGRRLPWVGLAAAGLMLANAGLHIGAAMAEREYNPGVGTAVVLFLPISLAYFGAARRYAGVGALAILGGIAFGIASHLMLPYVIEGAASPVWTSQLLSLFAVLMFAPLAANILSKVFRRA
jgi:Protein of unknown function with HXXEE motif